ncbi:G2/mitotic-specific cyclin-1 isoform X5 [Hevea brasiliensis]|uniref:G2/mitotic-specific cyclin-1 isoform X5 n=1 Tax=Hevea brasiliensis TaxID=3981 RepID=UPI0025CBC1C9|nr:G2/mitotic-specific cyclin-1 isoform X5 [Hevea brasiliensis]
MNISDENNPNIVKPTNFHGGLEMGSRKFGLEISHNRRALNVLNQKFIGAQAYPCVVNKRGLSENHGVSQRNPPNPAHRPITRKFAAQQSSTHQHCPQQETKKQKPSVPSTNGFGDCIFIDVEENKAPADHPVPMFLEQTEAILYEMDQMEEVDMEDIIEEPILDIDGCDAKNPLAVVDYVEDMYASYRKKEVHDKFELMKETLFLTVNLIDRFLSQQTVVRKKLQLVGLVAMLLACKYEEVSVPVVGDLILISDKAYNRKEVLEMESLMLNRLQFNMSFPTPYVFMQRFLKAAQCDKKIELLSFFLIELSIVEYEMLKFPPSLLAAAAIYTAQCTIYGFKQWSRTCECHSSYSEDQLLECSRLMVGFHQKAGTGTGAHRKYNTSKFGYTSKCEPALFLLETQK